VIAQRDSLVRCSRNGVVRVRLELDYPRAFQRPSRASNKPCSIAARETQMRRSAG